MSECSICVSNQSLKLGGKAKIVATTTINGVLAASIKSIGVLNSNKIQQLSLLKSKASASSKIQPNYVLLQNLLALQSSDNSNIKSHLQSSGILRSRVGSLSKFNNSYTDKFSGHISKISSIKDFSTVQKLYPIKDKVTGLNNSYFVNKYLSSGNLYDSIDEGLFTGNYNEHLNKSRRISDDNSSYIQPSSIFTSGTFRYKCEVSRPYHHPKESFLFIRAAAPLSNYGASIPPEYRIHNIRLEDPSGNLIVKYKDITLRGDADYLKPVVPNYVTYISEPEINNANLHTWESDYPILSEPSGYTLNMDFDVICLDDPFDTGFNLGYEERACSLKFVDSSENDYVSLDGSPLSTQTQGYNLNPTNTIRISALEICNSGDLCNRCSVSGIKRDNKFNFYTEVNPIGQRLSRTIYPVEVLLNNQNINIYPETYSTWISSPDSENNTSLNTSLSGCQVLTSRIGSDDINDSISLINSSPVSDSGRLTLKFKHKPYPAQSSLLNGAFDFSSSNEFDRANRVLQPEHDNFFLIDSIELKIVAKKAIGSRDYALDIVGYSDDKLLNVTPKIGAFLQNSQIGSGNVPLYSGFYPTNEFGLSSVSISEKDQYFENYLTSIDAGDHYKLSTLPVINSTSYQTYTIPLSIYEDYVTVGKSKDYSMSSYFENLYVDIYPIPSGASIASISLVVHYRPSNGISLHTFGTPSTKELGRRDVRLLPLGRNNNNDISVNSYVTQNKLSFLSGIPHSYSENNTLKTNYSRRWRGVDGNIVSGPYDPNQFDFSFYNPENNNPFLNGYFDLTKSSGNYIVSENYQYSGYYNGSNSILKNIGLRFNNQQLFPHSTNYTTIDWTQSGDPLYGKICDAFDSAIRLSGSNGNINFGNTPLSSGFSLYIRFSPDYNMSGVNHNLYNSGVLLSKWNQSNNLELALGFENGRITAFFNDVYSGLVKVQDSQTYDKYQYPLSILLTYDKNPSGNLNLYCNNEIENYEQLRASGTDLSLISGNSNLVVGYCAGSGVGSNIFLHEIGISHSGNLVHSNPNRLLKQTTASSFLDGHSHSFSSSTLSKYKLHSFVDEDTSKWNLGDFKICAFSPDFLSFTDRIGKDYIIHQLTHSGSGYSQITNLTLPSSVYASGLSYHSQIENGSLRFNLQDMPDANPEFYAIPPRICKTLPRDYNFVEKALAVDTVVEYESSDNITWPDGSIGPKLIVSLYTKNKNPIDRPSKNNWGLINRSIHYLEPFTCYEKLTSTFNYKDLIDTSEPWALFDLDNIISEFDHKYYSADINDMFLQYDIAYPSGSSFESKVKIHSSNVRLDNSLVYWKENNNQFNLYSSGDPLRFIDMNLFTVSFDAIRSPVISGSFNFPLGLFEIKQSGYSVTNTFSVPATFILNGGADDDILINGQVYEDGKYPYFGPLNGSHSYSYETLLQPGETIVFGGRDNGFGGSVNGSWKMYGYGSPLFLYTAGSPWPTANNGINLFASGVYGIQEGRVNLFVKNSGIVSSLGPDLYVSGGYLRDEQKLPLVMIDNSSLQNVYNTLPIFVKQTGPAIFSDNSILNLYMPESYSVEEFGKSSSFNLYLDNSQIFVNDLYSNINLYLQTDAGPQPYNESFVLFTSTYTPRTSLDMFSWNRNIVGTSIDPIIDANIPYLEANDEIRGVDLLCYGNCSNNNSCKEDPIIIHDSSWYANEICVDGGILRAKNTYTNLEVSGFKTPIGYSGDFYGIRKFTGLIPNSPYDITLTTQTGSNKSISTPSEFTEIDYGSNDYINYSGVKLASDDERQAGNKYGKSVSAKYDLIAIGAPMQDVSYQEYDSSGNLITTNLQEAGSVFLYRRDSRPSGYSWPDNQHKSQWNLESKLTLPSGLLKDYATENKTNIINGVQIPEQIIEKRWNVGQEGRQFGHSLDIGINKSMTSFKESEREILVVGGPSAKWNRNFEDLQTSGVSIGLIVFTDEFSPVIPPDGLGFRFKTYQDVLDAIQNKDLVFTYFSDPPVKFNVKLMICEPISYFTNTTSLDFDEPKPSFIVKKRIPRNVGIVTEEDIAAVFSGIKSTFDEAFPYDPSKLYNNSPVMLGIYVDNSRSLGRSSVGQGLDRFLSYYKDYSFNNGLQDFFGTRASGTVYEFDSSNANSEDWIDISKIIVNNLLDTGRLIRDDQVKFFSSGIGLEFFNSNLSQFNYPPNSGGRVYVFEKESGSWNLIQEIQSPVVSYDTIDRFGHSVAISEDTTVIGIGSPYINECCKIYEYKNSEKERLFSGLSSWLPFKSSLVGGTSNRYIQLIQDYNEWVNVYGSSYANEILYSKLSSTEKFEARKYLNIQEYQNIYTYRYSDIPYVRGNWSFIPEHFAPTSRLGYSVAVNENGSIVAFGAPTDSFNVSDDMNVYYKNRGYNDPLNIGNLNTSNELSHSWKSNVNAGAVRVFDSRRYFPHSGVVEFGKFGNLQQSLNIPSDSGHFNYISGIFNDKYFRKMTEGEVDIPQDAGLAFIITPGEDALSDEIVDNILAWLSLGDRNLVLVGNDPVWESNGIYKISNDIINNLLDRLDSRMRLHPARNQYESLPSGSSTILPSFRPTFGTSSYVLPFQLKTASGVGDIRMHFPNYNSIMPCVDPADENDIVLNSKCELPLVHNGDLRAQWISRCISRYNGSILTYPVNWPLVFQTHIPACSSPVSEQTFDLPNQEPIPLLVAAEQKVLQRIIPAVSEVYSLEPILRPLSMLSMVTNFVNDELSNTPSFVWDSENPSGYSSYTSNINGIVNNNTWYQPSKFQDRQSLLQSSASTRDELIIGNQLVTDICSYCVEQICKYSETSKIIAIASVTTESQTALYNSANDQNINFYVNMVSKSVNGESNIAQLGGWTGRSSFKSAYSGSLLKEIFLNTGNDVYENVINLSSIYDVCWIANSENVPTESEINELKIWLSSGNKRLIITHDSSIDRMLVAKNILELLETNIKPLYLPVRETYPKVLSYSLNINQYHPIYNGFDKYPISTFNTPYSIINFTPFAQESGVINIAQFNEQIYDNKLITNTFFGIDTGADKVVFPATPGSGYKIFVSYISEYPSENIRISLYVNNASEIPVLPPPINARPEFAQGTFNYNTTRTLSPTIRNQVVTLSFNVQVSNSKDNIELYFESLYPRLGDLSYIPKTLRVLSVSGVQLPIRQSQVTTPNGFEVIGYNRVLVSSGIPEQIVFDTVDGPISSYNDKYCLSSKCIEYGLGGQLIADGPVVAAQEICFKASFNAGVARSRITVLSDSNLVQGRYMKDEFGRLSAETVGFIRSLYPTTNFPSNITGRQYTELTKIVGPERGSPQKYLSINNSNGLKYRFNNMSGYGSMSSFSDKESMYDPRYVIQKEAPWDTVATSNKVEEIKQIEISGFSLNVQNQFGASAKFSGIVDGTMYTDAGIGGGIPQLMKDTGGDYLDFDKYPSGYPGDLFGYSVSINKNKLIVGSPFNAFVSEDTNNWNYHTNTSGSLIKTSYNGGAGSVYLYEKTFRGSGVRNTIVPWEFVQKLRPNSINIGQDITNSGTSQSYLTLGPNSYSNSYLTNNSITTDQFGYDVSIDSDVIVIGSPGHDFGNSINNVYNSGCFIRKAFNGEFDIPSRIVTDLGNSGIRNSIGSGLVVLNNGAIFTYENSIYDWTNRLQRWKLIEKIVPQGNNRQQNINENDNFGRSVCVHRSLRSDSDYVIIGGCENNDYSSSGTDYISNAGSAYTHDIVLRESPPTRLNPNAYIDSKVFGERTNSNEPTLKLITTNSIPDQTITASGTVYSDKNGAIFLEVSGKDPALKGFIQHRPFVVSVDGLYRLGSENSGNIPLFISGDVFSSGSMNLYATATTGNVYNTLGLYNSSIVDFGSGILNFYTDCPAPTEISQSGLPLFTASGIGISAESLNMRIRGY